MSIHGTALLAGVILASAGGARAATEPPTLPTKVVEASLFKNGLGFIVREATLPGPGEYVIAGLPVPVHGSFWVTPQEKATVLKEARAFSLPRSESEEAVTLVELLKANVGKPVEIRTEREDWVAGTLLAVPERAPKLPVSAASAAAEPGYYGTWGAPARAYRPPSADGGKPGEAPGFLLLKTEKGTLAMSPADVKGVRSTEDLARSFTHSRPGAGLRLKVAGGGGKVRVAYLAWGLTWAPSYQVDISDPKEASVQCKATVMDDIEDLKGTDLSFITGFPNLAFAEAVDPLAMVGDVSDFVQSLMSLGDRSSRRRGGRSSVLTQQAVMVNAAIPGEGGGPAPYAPGEGEVREDLFFYPQPDATLQRGERGYYPLFAKRVPYDSLYMWEIEDSLDEQNRWRYAWWYGDGRDQQDEPEEVWHTLRLTNAGGIPWTTAPAMTVQAGRVLGQDTLHYTASGAKTLLRITRAVDIRAEQSETEADRVRGARTAYGGDFDLVTIKGELRVYNYRNKPVTLLIKKTLSGEVLDTAPQPTVTTTTRGVWRVNPQQLLNWELPVEAGGKVYVTYRYKVYAHR